MGYAQELERRLSRFSNFAVSFSIICILSGGINSLAQGTSGAGGIGIGVGWLVGCFVSLTFAVPCRKSARPILRPAASITGVRSSATAAPAGSRPG